MADARTCEVETTLGKVSELRVGGCMISVFCLMATSDETSDLCRFNMVWR
jgi:hypothetical protein